MGARAQVKVGEVFLYTHWGSGTLIKDVRKGLSQGQGRWSDPEYLARIIFDNLKNPEFDDPVTGYGISTYLHGDLDFWLEINCDERKIYSHHYSDDGEPKISWTFDSFLNREDGMVTASEIEQHATA